MTKDEYEAQLYDLQVELVKLQKHLIHSGEQILVILEGRDAAGKDGVAKSIVEHLSPRDTRVVALGKPTERELGEWYFQRYVAQLPGGGECILFNRSWYNRAGVEKVMGFCTKKQHEQFMGTVNDFESVLVRSGVRLFKYYLDISKDEQAQRLDDRRKDPLTQWKISPIDQQAQKKWSAYSEARDEMLRRTHHSDAPWTVVQSDNKKHARLNLIRDFLGRLEYQDKKKAVLAIDPAIVLQWPTVNAHLPMLEA
jgi:polyphosphate kinase 2